MIYIFINQCLRVCTCDGVLWVLPLTAVRRTGSSRVSCLSRLCLWSGLDCLYSKRSLWFGALYTWGFPKKCICLFPDMMKSSLVYMEHIILARRVTLKWTEVYRVLICAREPLNVILCLCWLSCYFSIWTDLESVYPPKSLWVSCSLEPGVTTRSGLPSFQELNKHQPFLCFFN